VVTRRRDLGDFGERLAAHRLEAGGLRIVARKARVKAGEIDLVATDGADVVFVEVRTRRAAPGLAAESVDDRKVVRMWECAMQYCEREAIDPERARIDMVSVDLDAGGKVLDVLHLKGLEVPEIAE
jgi:putative endonuclease